MLVSICESTVLYIEYLHNIGNDWFIFSYFQTIKLFGGGISNNYKKTESSLQLGNIV